MQNNKPSASEIEKQTIDYYDQNAAQFIDSTFHLNMSELYAPFIKLLPPGAEILDAGCGPGRDALHFKNLGYLVTAFDASPKMAEIASERTGLPVRVMTFQEMVYREEFDGIWACASLLHVPTAEIHEVIDRLITALKPAGVLYASFKYGAGDIFRNGRLFSNYTEETFKTLVASHPQLVSPQIWTTCDIRPGRDDEKWLNTLLRKNS